MRASHEQNLNIIVRVKCTLFTEHETYFFGPPVFCPALGCLAYRGDVCTPHGKFRVPSGLRGSCFGTSKSRIMASNHSQALWPATTKLDKGNPHNQSGKQQVLACSVLCTYYYWRLTWSPCHLTSGVGMPGHLAPRLFAQATAAMPRTPFYMPRCFRMCCVQGRHA